MESKLEGAGKGVGRKLVGSGIVVGWKLDGSWMEIESVLWKGTKTEINPLSALEALLLWQINTKTCI